MRVDAHSGKTVGTVLKFDPKNPYPSCEVSYAEAQAHSALVDTWLGLECESNEAAIEWSKVSVFDQNLWRDLPPKTLMTPYTEFRALLERLAPKPSETIVDLGCAYGRCGFVIARHFPKVSFVGYEFVRERAEAGQRAIERAGLPSSIRIEVADLASPEFRPITAEYYFIYDFGSRRAIAKVLEDLRSIAQTKRIRVVGRGRAIRDAIEQTAPWLASVQEPEHFDHYSIYRS